MKEPARNSPLRQLDPVESAKRKTKGLGPVGQGALGAILLIGQAMVVTLLVEAQAPELATVNRAELAVYAQTDSNSTVVSSLLRGDLVEIDQVILTPEGPWCSITQIGASRTTGYVQCDALQRRPASPSKPLVFIEEPIPKPQTGVTVPQAKPGRGYTIQVAALVRAENLRALKARLEKLGFHPMIQVTTAPITHHRVYVGQFNGRAEAELTAKKLREDGYRASLVEREDRTFTLDVGSSFRRDGALTLARTLQEKGYSSKIASTTNPTQVHQVRVGEYQNQAEARKALEALRKQGFAPLIVRQ